MEQKQYRQDRREFWRELWELLFPLRVEVLLAMVLLYLAALGFMFIFRVDRYPTLMLSCTVFMLVMLCVLVLYGCQCAGEQGDQRQELVFEGALLSLFFFSCFSVVGNAMQGRPALMGPVLWCKALSLICSGIWTVGINLYYLPFFRLDAKQQRRIEWLNGVGLLAVAALCLASVWTGLLFRVNSRYWVEYPRTYLLIDILAVWSYGFNFVQCLRAGCDLRTRLTLLSYSGFMMLCVVVDTVDTLRKQQAAEDTLECLVAMAALMSILMIFCNVHVEYSRQLLKKETQLAESQMHAMGMQMNPHLIYNTLGSISVLCREDPARAAEWIDRFAGYLRENFSESQPGTMISFEEEIRHLEQYIALEKLRFPNIEFEMELEVMDFMLPGMTIQPLVENAIHHGIRGRRGGGLVSIFSYETKRDWCIRVEDNGAGFTQQPQDGRRHLGLENTRYRLKTLCGGTLSIRSVPGSGTSCTVVIPKQQGGEKNDRALRR